MERVILSLGSNLGEREQYLTRAIALIEEAIGEIRERSTIRESESWGFNSTPFLNLVIIISTPLSPTHLLTKLQEIEKKLGREHKTQYLNGTAIYSDRTIDIDILYYGELKMESEALTIPHPKIAEREFILQPLRELGIIQP